MIWSGVDTLSSLVLNIVITLSLARVISPESFGIIAMLAIVIMVGEVVVNGGMSEALIRKTDRVDSDVSTAFCYNLVAGLAYYILIYLLSPLLAEFYDFPLLTEIARTLGVVVVLNSLSIVPQSLLTSELKFKKMTVVSLLSLVLSGVLALVMALSGCGVWSLVGQQIYYHAIRMVSSWLICRWGISVRFSYDSFKTLYTFGSKLLMSGLIDAVYSNIYTVVIGKIFNPALLGCYNKAVTISGLPSKSVTSSVLRVVYPMMSSVKNDDQQLEVDFKRMLSLLAYVIFPLMVGVIVLAEPFVLSILTNDWLPMVPMMQILASVFILWPIHVLNLDMLKVKGRSELYLRLEILKKVIGITLLVCMLPYGVTAVCIGQLISSIVALILNSYYTRKLIGVGLVDQVRVLLPAIVNASIMGVVIVGVKMIVDSQILVLLVGVTVGVGCYLLINRLMRSSVQREMIEVLSKLRIRRYNEK